MSKKKAIEPLEAIKRLLIVQTLALGVKANTIAEILEIDASGIRKLVSLKSISKSKS